MKSIKSKIERVCANNIRDNMPHATCHIVVLIISYCTTALHCVKSESEADITSENTNEMNWHFSRWFSEYKLFTDLRILSSEWPLTEDHFVHAAIYVCMETRLKCAALFQLFDFHFWHRKKVPEIRWECNFYYFYFPFLPDNCCREVRCWCTQRVKIKLNNWIFVQFHGYNVNGSIHSN